MNNDLGDLFEWVAKVTNVRNTSKEAYAELKDEGTLGKQEETILSVMKEGWNYSLQEISQLTGIAINAVSGRVNGLKKKGWLVECEKRPCSVTGKNITPVMKP
jgi:predicted transcriptional regulator